MDDAAAIRSKRPRRERSPTSPDPIEIAMEAEASGQPAVGQAALLLADQRRLIGWQISSERMGAILKLLAAIVAVAAAAVLALMAWTASRADGLLIEAFETPPELQAQGYTGAVLAAQLQDKLGRMQRQTISRDAAASVRDFRSTDIHVQIPYAGISLGEVDRMLRSSLGRETPVRGEVVKLASGPDAGALAATVRVGGEPGSRVLAKDGDIDGLLQRAAEEVYRSRDLERYLNWLLQRDRKDDALAVAQAYEHAGSAHQQAVAQHYLATRLFLGDMVDRERRLRLAVHLDPGDCGAVNDLGTEYARAGRTEAALRYYRQSLICDISRKGLSPEGRRVSVALRRSNVAAALQDAPAYLAGNCVILGVAPCSPGAVATAAEGGELQSQVDQGFFQRLPIFARNLGRLHDVDDAARIVATNPLASGDQRGSMEWLQAAGQLAIAREDWPGVLSNVEAVEAIASKPGYGLDHWITTSLQWRPYALLKLGRPDEALAAAAALPGNCYVCIVARAKMLGEMGRRAEAEAAFADAEHQGPSLPQAQTEWAAFRLSQGDADGAIARAKVAHRRSPGYPDALKVWGEALLAKGDARAAAAKFGEAAKLAPWWGRLHLKWGAALSRAGKTAEAQDQWRQAGTFFLTPPERAELAKVQGAH